MNSHKSITKALLVASLFLFGALVVPPATSVTTEADCDPTGHEVIIAEFCQSYVDAGTADYHATFAFDGIDIGADGTFIFTSGTATITVDLYDFEGDAKSFPDGGLQPADLILAVVAPGTGSTGPGADPVIIPVLDEARFGGVVTGSQAVFSLDYASVAALQSAVGEGDASAEVPFVMRVESQYTAFLPTDLTNAFSFYSELANEAPDPTLADALDLYPTTLTFIPDEISPVFEADNSASSAGTGDDFQFSFDATDNIGVSAVTLDVTVTDAAGTTQYTPAMAHNSGNTWAGAFTVPEDALEFTYTATATDGAGNAATTSPAAPIDVSDTLAPSVTDVTPTGPATGDFTVEATITDNIALDASTVSITVNDMAGVVAQNGDVFSAVFTAADVDPDGSYDIVIAAQDDATNPVDFRQAVVFDNTAPIVTLLGNGAELSTAWYTVPVTLDLSVDDGDGSGVDGIMIDDGTGPVAYDASDLPTLDDGVHTVAAEATDFVGLIGSNAAVVSIDTVAPTSTVSNAVDSSPLGPSYTTGPLALTFDASDAASGSGVDSVMFALYKQGAAASVPAPWDDIPVNVSDGDWVLDFYAVDIAGNAEAPSQVQFFVDINGPVVSFVPDDANILEGTNGWFKAASASGTLLFEDASTITSQQYKLAATDAWSDYVGQPLTFTTGVNTIYVQAEDSFQHATTGAFEINLDDIAPAVGHDLAGSSEGPNADVVDVTLIATDATSGLAGITYTIENAGTTSDPMDYAAPIHFAQAGSYTVAYTATDNAGNSASSFVSFSVDLEAPTIEADITGDAGTAGWYRGPVSILATATDDLDASNDLTFTYSVDGGAEVPVNGAFGVSTEGAHTVLLTATDSIDKVQTLTLSFSIDTVDPTADATGVGASWNTAGVVIVTGTDSQTATTIVAHAVQGAVEVDASGASPLNLTLGDGTWTITYQATDAAGRMSAEGSATAKVDTTVPVAVPGNFDASWIQESSFDALIEASDVTSGVVLVEYKVWPASGAESAYIAGEAFAVGEGAWLVRARVTDDAGLVFESGDLPLNVDATMPDVTDSSDIEARTGAPFVFAVSATDAVSGVSTVVATWHADDPAATHDVTLAYDAGLQQFVGMATVPTEASTLAYAIRVADAAGNEVYVNGAVPVVDGIAPTIDSAVASGTTVGGHLVGAVTLTVTAQDNVGLANVSFLDGATLLGTDTDGSDGWTQVFTPVGEGAKNITVRAVDVANNSADGFALFVYDNLAPTTANNALPAGWVVAPTGQEVSVTATDGGTGVASIEYKLYCGTEPTAFTPYTAKFFAMDQGSCTLKHRGTDLASNVGEAVASTLKIDRTPPAVAFVGAAPVQADAGSSVPVTVTASDAHSGLAKVELVFASGTQAMARVGTTNTYSGTIVIGAGQDNVQYRVRATDNATLSGQTDFTTIVVNDYAKQAAAMTTLAANSLRVDSAKAVGNAFEVNLTFVVPQGAAGVQLWRSTSPFLLVAEFAPGAVNFTDSTSKDGAIYVLSAYVENGGTAFGKAVESPENNIPNFASLGRVRAVSSELVEKAPAAPGKLPVYTVNNPTDVEKTYTIVVTIYDANGQAIGNKTFNVTVGPFSSQDIDPNEDGLLDGGTTYSVESSRDGNEVAALQGAVVVPAGPGADLWTEPLFWIGLMLTLAVVGVLMWGIGAFVGASRAVPA